MECTEKLFVGQKSQENCFKSCPASGSAQSRRAKSVLDSVQRAVSRMINPDNHDLICQKRLGRILHFPVLTAACVPETEMIVRPNGTAQPVPLFY